MFGPDPLPLEVAERLAKTQSGRKALEVIEELLKRVKALKTENQRLRTGRTEGNCPECGHQLPEKLFEGPVCLMDGQCSWCLRADAFEKSC